jgi:hypothetical protein
MDKPKSEPSEFNIAERIVIGVAAASGLITAACISGLPSTSCTALAQTYTSSVIYFGSTALGALFTLSLIFFSRPRILNVKNNGKKIWKPELLINFYRATVFCSLALASFLFVGSSFAGRDNLQDAARHCFQGTDIELAQRAHQQMQLESPLDWKAWRLGK